MAYPATVWAALKAAYESGEYGSVAELAKCPKLAKKYGKLPKSDAIEVRLTKEGWKKASLAPAIEALTRENLIKALADRGINTTKVAKKIDEQLSAVKTVIDSSGEANTTPDNTAVDKAITQTAKIVGLYAPTQVENVTPAKLDKFIIDASSVILSHVKPEDVDAVREELAALLDKYDSDEN